MNRPIVLTGENVGEYFNDVVLPHLPEGSEVTDTREVTEYTMVNWIFAVGIRLGSTGEHNTTYLKQSRDYVKGYTDMERPANRIGIENKVLDFLHTVIPENVPEVIVYDEPNNVLAMTDIQRSGRLLLGELLAGRAHPEVGGPFGAVIARVQLSTFDRSLDDILGIGINQGHADMASILGFRVKPAQRLYPELTNQVLKRSDEGPKCFILGDLSSKNIFVEGNQARFVDFERVAVGDPAHDPAYLFAHMLVQIKPDQLTQAVEFVDKFMKSYTQKLREKFSSEELDRLQNQIARFLGITILHRVLGEYFVVDVGEDKELWQERAATLLADTKSTSVVEALGQAGIA
ncbi:MAG TPA: phosphotransferase [Candidatus Saccharimonadales bacterium]|nr:phosphotransferase [Candidatus Saccharimonadales bacterium]